MFTIQSGYAQTMVSISVDSWTSLTQELHGGLLMLVCAYVPKLARKDWAGDASCLSGGPDDGVASPFTCHAVRGDFGTRKLQAYVFHELFLRLMRNTEMSHVRIPLFNGYSRKIGQRHAILWLPRKYLPG